MSQMIIVMTTVLRFGLTAVSCSRIRTENNTTNIPRVFIVKSIKPIFSMPEVAR